MPQRRNTSEPMEPMENVKNDAVGEKKDDQVETTEAKQVIKRQEGQPDTVNTTQDTPKQQEDQPKSSETEKLKVAMTSVGLFSQESDDESDDEADCKDEDELELEEEAEEEAEEAEEEAEEEEDSELTDSVRSGRTVGATEIALAHSTDDSVSNSDEPALKRFKPMKKLFMDPEVIVLSSDDDTRADSQEPVQPEQVASAIPSSGISEAGREPAKKDLDPSSSIPELNLSSSSDD